jgi:hypothetical protein
MEKKRNDMDKRCLLPSPEFPTSNHLAAAIRKLPRARAEQRPCKVEVDAGPSQGQYRVTFVVRRNVRPGPPAWFWGVEGSERFQSPARKQRSSVTEDGEVRPVDEETMAGA